MSPSTESPHSSLGDSFGGTPDTRFTAFSPEDTRVLKNNNSVALSTPHKEAVAHDPFISAHKVKGEQTQLRAVAPEFTLVKKSPIPGSADHLINIIESATAPVLELIEPEITSYGVFTINTLKTRNLRIASLSNRDAMHLVEISLVNLENSGYKLKGMRRIASAGTSIFLKLENIDDVAMVHTALQSSGDLSIEFIAAGEFSQIVSPHGNMACSSYEGQVALRVSYAAKLPTMSKKQFGETFIDLLSIDGTLCAWKRYSDPTSLHLVAEFSDLATVPRAIARLNGQAIGTGIHLISVTYHQPDLPVNTSATRFQSPTHTPTRRGEAFDLSNAMGNLNIGNGLVNGNFSPMQGTPMSGYGQAAQPLILQMGSYGVGHPTYFQGGQLAMGGYHALSPALSYNPAMMPAMNSIHFGSPQDLRQYGQDHSPVSNRDGYGQRRINQSRVNTPGRGRIQNSLNNHHNIVEVERIRAGIDVRTTIMLRNIPNKVDQAMLKAIVDESSFGKYDFMYLRIDFSNNCNVGYAFINFCDPLDIIEFVEVRANKPWDSFKSDKIAEVSYATIQGRDCLIQKFRNSSVMLEPVHYRPKLFFTSEDVFGRVGQEDIFPSSDNASKLKRSCENAEHVGLFAPSAGQHMRDEQRRRRSQYDRGTSLAAREEFEYDPFGYTPY